jgi:hypothetical protein
MCCELHLLLPWRYSPYRALASPMRCLQNCLSLAFVFHAFVPSNLIQSSHLFLGFPTTLLPYTSIIYCRAFLGIRSSFNRITCLSHCSLLNLINIDTLTSLYRSYISVLYLIIHTPYTFLGPYICLKIFLSKASSISSDLLVIVQASHP